MGAALFGHFTASTLFAVPHESLGAELAREHHDRTRIFGVRHVLYTFGIFAALAGIFLLVRSGAPRDTAFTLIATAGGLTAVLTMLAVALLREPAEHQGRGGQRPFAAFADVLRNPHARLLLVVFAIETIGTATLGILLPYVLEYVVGRPDLIPQLIAVYMVPAVLFVPLWIALSRRIGKKPLWLGSMCAMTLAFSALFLVGPGDWLYVAVLALLAGVGGGCGAVVAPSIQADIIDWDELRTGERKEGAYFAVWSFVRKGAFGLTAGATGIALASTGFVPNAEQPPETLLAMRALFGLFPGACYLAGYAAVPALPLHPDRASRRARGPRDARAAPPPPPPPPNEAPQVAGGHADRPRVSASSPAGGSMLIVAAIGGGAFVLASLIVSLPLLALARRTGELPELPAVHAVLSLVARAPSPCSPGASSGARSPGPERRALLHCGRLARLRRDPDRPLLGVEMTATVTGVVVGPLGVTSAGAMWLAFLPPERYVSWILAHAGKEA